MSIRDYIKEIPELRKIVITFALACISWLAFLLLASEISSNDRTADGNISSSEQIMSIAMTYKASSGNVGAAHTEKLKGEPLTVLSDIIDGLGIRDRLVQLQSNASGIAIQVERLYGDEFEALISTIDSRGLSIKTSDVKALPVNDERLISSTLLLEPK